MKRLILGLGGLAIVLTMVMGSVATTNAAHLGNNKAEIVGTGDPDAEGQSTVNYREGTGSFNASATVSNLEPGATYTFVLVSATGEEEICEANANRQGKFQCGDQDVLQDEFGLTTAVIRDSENAVVAMGPYDRRGNCRAPDQGGSQCEAPGLNR